ncbi:MULTISPECIES: DUF726 domain-containing protein [Aeromicrobium]|nr:MULTISPECIES: DUF726 domain-containing protein [Aeromicrobium]
MILEGDLDTVEPEISGAIELTANPALVRNAWAYAKHHKLSRRMRKPEKVEAHLKESKAHHKVAAHIADLIETQTSSVRKGWCSSCISLTTHAKSKGDFGRLPAYLCGSCGSPTVVCAAPPCSNMAVRSFKMVKTPRYCAEHRHDITGFEKASSGFSDLADANEFLTFDKPNLSRGTKTLAMAIPAAGAVATGAVFMAPAIGGAIGVFAGGYSGAAATSYGLALLGGGSIASGGLGVAGGTAAIGIGGGILGGGLGSMVTTAYARDDKSFNIQKLREGAGIPVVIAAGFMNEGKSPWVEWKPMVRARYPDSPVYLVNWGSSELKKLSGLISPTLGKGGAAVVGSKFAAKATKLGAKKIGPSAAALLVADVAKNPWHVAKSRADKTGVVLGDLLTRTDADAFVLIGHSLGARVMVVAAQTVAAGSSNPKIETIHLLGGAIAAKGNWRSLNDAVTKSVYNYHSSNDLVLKNMYRIAQAGSTPIGLRGFRTSFPKIRDRDVSKRVDGHRQYIQNITLA